MSDVPPEVKVVGARVVRVSRRGMTIESPVALEGGSVSKLRLVVAGEKADVEARVVTCTPASGSGRGFELGLEFTLLPSSVRERLVRVLTAPRVRPG